MKILVAGDVSFDGGDPSQTCLSELSFIGRDYTIFNLLKGSINSEHMSHLVDAEVSHIYGGEIDDASKSRLGGLGVLFTTSDIDYTLDDENKIVSCVVNGESDLVRVGILRNKFKNHLLACFIVWGEDYLVLPEEQRAFARKLIDSEADLVVGSCPRVLPFEFYRGKPICYSLGNIYSPKHQVGYVTILEFDDKHRVTSFSHSPIMCAMDKTKVLNSEPVSEIGLKALEIAQSCVGQGELETETNRGPFINHIGAIPGKAWCSQFASYCLINAYKELGKEVPFERQQRAKKLHKELIDKGVGFMVLTPVPGDVLIWDREEEGGEAGHVGIVESVEGDKVVVIEGNHPPSPGSKVDRFTYSLSDLVKYSGWDYTIKDFHLFEGLVRVMR